MWEPHVSGHAGLKPRLEEPFFSRGQKKQNFEPESSQRSYPHSPPAGLQRTREGGSPLVQALSGQSQTEKLLSVGQRINASSRLVGQRERER